MARVKEYKSVSDSGTERSDRVQRERDSNKGSARERRERNARIVASNKLKRSKLAAKDTPAPSEDVKSLERSKRLEEIKKKYTSKHQEGTDKQRVERDRLSSGLMTDEERTKFLNVADEGMDMTSKDVIGLLSKIGLGGIGGAGKAIGGSVKRNWDQQQRLLDAIEKEYGVDRKTAGEIARVNKLTSTQRYDTAGSARDRSLERREEHRGNVADARSGGGGGWSDYVAAKTGTTPAAPAPGSPNMVNFSFGGSPISFQPRAIWGPQIAREEIASREGIADAQLQAGEPGYLDTLAGIGSVVSSIWGD